MIHTRYDVSWRRGHLTVALVVLLACAAALGVRWAQRPVWLGHALPVDSRRVALATERINPNTASVGSLRRLPGLGPVRAQAVADYAAVRQGSPISARPGSPKSARPDLPTSARQGTAFGRAEDLTAVEGIGPGTVERIRPYLVFGQGGN